MSNFIKMPSTTFTAVAALIGFFLIDGLGINAQNALGNFLMLAGQILETNASQQAYLQGLEHSNTPPLPGTSPSSHHNGTAPPATPTISTQDLPALAARLEQLQQELASLKTLLEQQGENG